MTSKIKQIRSALLLAFVGITTSVSAQQNYGFEEIIRLGLENSHQLKINQSEQLDNELAVTEAKFAYAPNLSVSGQGMLLNSPTIQLMGEPSSLPSPKSAAFVMGSLSVPIFNGFKLKNNLSLNQELVEAGIAAASVDSTVVICSIIDAYVTLYKAQRSKALIVENLVSQNKRLSDFEKLKANGLLTENDYLVAQIAVSQLEISLIDVTNQEEIAQYDLNVLAGLSEDTKFTADSLVLFNVPVLMDGSENSNVLDNRKDYLSLEHQMTASEYAVKIQKSNYYPHVSFSGMYVSLYVPNTLTVGNVLNAGVGISFDLSAFYKNGTAVERQHQKVVQLDEQMQQLADKIKVDVHRGYLGVQSSFSKVDLYYKMVFQATENYRSVNEKFDNNLSTTADLLEADVQLLQAKINMQLAQADLFLAYINYLKVSGNLEKLKSL